MYFSWTAVLWNLNDDVQKWKENKQTYNGKVIPSVQEVIIV